MDYTGPGRFCLAASPPIYAPPLSHHASAPPVEIGMGKSWTMYSYAANWSERSWPERGKEELGLEGRAGRAGGLGRLEGYEGDGWEGWELCTMY